MRFEVTAAYVMGVALPTLEVIRRRTNFGYLPAYVDDFIIGAFLLYAARSVTVGKRNGGVLLVAAWGALCGGLYNSFFGQLNNSAATDVSGYSNMLVVLIKGILYLVAITGLIMAVRSATAEQRDGPTH